MNHPLLAVVVLVASAPADAGALELVADAIAPVAGGGAIGDRSEIGAAGLPLMGPGQGGSLVLLSGHLAAYPPPSALDITTDPMSSVPVLTELRVCNANPVRASAHLEVRIAGDTDASVSLEVFDVRGRRVAVLVDGTLPPGSHDVRWDASSTVSAGVYFLRLLAGDLVDRRRLVVAE